ncbi:MAG: chemotaxis protein CheW [Solirubrobacterales bacterium]
MLFGEESRAVVFAIGENEYGFDVRQVEEIIKLPRVTELHRTAQYALGVSDLRGSVIPIFDLRQFLIHSEDGLNTEMCVIVLDQGTHKIGMVVDAVLDVVPFNAGGLIPLERMNDDANNRIDYQILNRNGRMITMLHMRS